MYLVLWQLLEGRWQFVYGLCHYKILSLYHERQSAEKNNANNCQLDHNSYTAWIVHHLWLIILQYLYKHSLQVMYQLTNNNLKFRLGYYWQRVFQFWYTNAKEVIILPIWSTCTNQTIKCTLHAIFTCTCYTVLTSQSKQLTFSSKLVRTDTEQ